MLSPAYRCLDIRQHIAPDSIAVTSFLSKPAAMASFIGACVRPARAQSLILVKARRVADAQAALAEG